MYTSYTSMNYILFPKTVKQVYDKERNIFYSLKEFKAIVGDNIRSEEAHQKRIQEIEIKMKQKPPYELDTLNEVYLKMMIEDSEDRIRKLRQYLKRLELSKDTELDVARARETLITDLIEFNSGDFAKCLWHSERTGSMKYYRKTNTVHCFSCSQSHDSIDVVQKLYNLDFVNAVKFLMK